MKDLSISIVAPFYNEARNGIIKMYFDEIVPVLESQTQDWEIVCIDDGSKDSTYLELCMHASLDKRIKILQFSRNFGKEIAISAGIKYASKNCVIPMDTDLQDPVALIPQMINEWKAGALVVLAKRSKREEGIIKKIGCYFFYKLLKAFSDIQIPENTGDYRLVDRKVVDVFNQLPEKQRYVRGLWAWIGFEVKYIYFDRPDRALGRPTQNYRKLIKITFDALFSFSSIPLRFWVLIGFIIALLSMSLGFSVLIKHLFFGRDVPGWSSIMCTITFLGGIQLISIGVLGEYINRIYNEVKGRHLYIISNKVNIE